MNGLTTYQDATRREDIKGSKKGKKKNQMDNNLRGNPSGLNYTSVPTPKTKAFGNFAGSNKAVAIKKGKRKIAKKLPKSQSTNKG